MRRQLLVKIDQFCVANLAKTQGTRCSQSTRFAHGLGPAHGASFKRPKAGPMSGAIALGLACDWRLDLARSDVSDFNFAVPDA